MLNVKHVFLTAGRRPKPAAGAAGPTTACTPFGLAALKCTPWAHPGGHPWYSIICYSTTHALLYITVLLKTLTMRMDTHLVVE